jgi:hypothetical protein
MDRLNFFLPGGFFCGKDVFHRTFENLAVNGMFHQKGLQKRCLSGLSSVLISKRKNAGDVASCLAVNLASKL